MALQLSVDFDRPASAEAPRDPGGLEDIFGPPVSVYTRAQAVEDGVLVDAHRGVWADVTEQHTRTPVFMTRGVEGMIERAVENRPSNDHRGVWHDILTMAGLGTLRVGDRQGFTVLIMGLGRRLKHLLYVGV